MEGSETNVKPCAMFDELVLPVPALRAVQRKILGQSREEVAPGSHRLAMINSCCRDVAQTRHTYMSLAFVRGIVLQIKGFAADGVLLIPPSPQT